MAPNIKKETLYIFLVLQMLIIIQEANRNTRFDTCADTVSYLCKFETNLQDAKVTFSQLLAGKSFYNPVSISRKQARNFIINVILSNVLMTL